MSEKNNFFRKNKGLLGVFPFFVIMVVVITVLYQVSFEYSFYILAFFVITQVVALGIQYSMHVREKRDAEMQLSEPVQDQQERWLHYQENEDFFALWAHQIKTPIAALNVLLQEENVSTVACRQELIKIESYVEMAIGYCRYENMGNDLVLESRDLHAMVNGVVKKYSTIFIYKHLAIRLDQLDYSVLTDEKWFSFVLEQILSNALKYTSQGEIRIYGEECEKGLQVVIADTGIGIREEDLPRIFEKGFTGYNGRMDKKASGLGLYLCKGICQKLGHQIGVESKIEKGTKVTILLQYDRLKQADLTKM